jgi:phage/plasmid-associated DNA primase
MVFKIWSVKNYGICTQKFLEEKSVEINDVDEMIDELKNDNYYHFRIKKDTMYILFGDIDGYKKGFENFSEIFTLFMKKKYNVEIKKYSYTENTGKLGSYHFSVPDFFCNTEKLQEIFKNFSEENKNNNDFIYAENEKKIRVIDTTIYSEHWFRCPNQSKGDNSSGIHVIKKGKIKHFIIDNIPKKSININNFRYIEENIIKEDIRKEDKQNQNEKTINKSIEINNNEKIKNKKIENLKKFLNIYTQDYYDYYDFWFRIGMGYKKMSKKYNYDFKEDFQNFSKKSKKYNDDDFYKFWNNFNIEKITINEGSLYKYARDSSLGEYKKIMKELYEIQNFEITEKFIADTLKELLGENFVYKRGKIYCFNIRNKMWFEGYGLMKNYINDEIFDYLKNIIDDSIYDESVKNNQIKELKKYCLRVKEQEKICLTYENRNKYESIEEIEFNSKPFLIGFSNGVYDLQKNEFREYKFDDYMTIHTGYNYEKKYDNKKKDELELLFKKIMPNKKIRDYLFTVLSTGLINKQYQYFFIFNGSGGNGKSLVNLLMEIVLGNYHYILDTQYLTETKKQGACPELANMGHKRFVVSHEPSGKKKIKNENIKKFTGDDIIQGRACNSNETEIILKNTFIMNCNDKPLFEEPPKQAELRRTKDIPFESKFTDNNNEVDESKNIYKAEKIYTDREYLKKFRYAFLDILIEYSNKFISNNEIFDVPLEIEERTSEYMKKNYPYLEYLDELCEKNENNFINLGEYYEKIKGMEIYLNMTKMEKREITLKKIIEFFEKNKFTSKIYKDRYTYYDENKMRKNTTNVLLGYKFRGNYEDL